MTHRDPTGPLTPQLFHVLLALSDGELHGYAVMQAVERTTGGEVRLSAGTLYGVIKRLLAQGWIEETSSPLDDRRRTYRLTEAGLRAARDEARRLEALVGLARTHQLLPAGGGGSR